MSEALPGAVVKLRRARFLIRHHLQHVFELRNCSGLLRNPKRKPTQRTDTLDVSIKSEESLQLWLLLTHRRTLKRKVLDIENKFRHSVKVFGVRLGSGFGHVAFAKRVRAALADDAFLLGLTECMPCAWAVLWEEYNRFHKLLVKVMLQDDLCAS